MDPGSSCSHVPKVLLILFGDGGLIPAQGRRDSLGWRKVVTDRGRQPVGSSEAIQESLLEACSKTMWAGLGRNGHWSGSWGSRHITVRHCPVLMAGLHPLGTAQEAGGHHCFYRAKTSWGKCAGGIGIEGKGSPCLSLSWECFKEHLSPIAQPTARSSPTSSPTQMSKSIVWQCAGTVNLPTLAFILDTPHIESLL